MNERLILIEDVNPTQIGAICDHTFLNRSEAYRQSAGDGESPVRLRARAFRSFLEGTIANKERVPYAVCVRPEDVALTIDFLAERGYTGILVASVVGFPDGSLYDTNFKIAETRLAIKKGAREIDMVLNYDLFKAGYIAPARDDVQAVVDAAREHGALSKLIFETSELNADQIKRACQLASETGIDFVKTSTGFGAYGARVEDVSIMRANFNGGIKISGGVTPENVKSLLSAVSGRRDGYIELNPNRVRIGESSLLTKL
ncbi:deoxyribose-phosphate aldolase [Candidatus Woesearchaeota archaeon]|nr:deoxyribose-phosphate aldolase [Candidatus Woesearchaeota archaeon]